MSSVLPVRSVAACFALAAFSVSLFAGLIADRRAGDILQSALVALLVGQIVGVLAASILARIVGSSMERYKAAHPVPDSFDAARQLAVSGGNSSTAGQGT